MNKSSKDYLQKKVLDWLNRYSDEEGAISYKHARQMIDRLRFRKTDFSIIISELEHQKRIKWVGWGTIKVQKL